MKKNKKKKLKNYNSLNRVPSPELSETQSTNKTDKTIQNAIAYFCVAALFFLLSQLNTIDNTIGGMSLCWQGARYGLCASIAITILLLLLRPSVYYGIKVMISMLLAIFLGPAMLCAATLHFINSHYAEKNIYCNSYKIIEKATGKKARRMLFIKTPRADKERFEVSKDIYNSVHEGGYIQLCTKKGKLGYHFITRIGNHHPNKHY
jgi:hypothetical protein